MTYSRPTTSTVNALDLPTPYQPLGAPGRQEVSITGNGRFMDFSNPAQAGKNAGQDTAAIGSFLSSIIKPGADIYKGYLQGQATNQVGKFMQTVDVENLYRSADPAGRDMLRSLNPFAQDAVNAAAAGSSVKSYLENLAVLRAENKTLVNRGATPAERATAEASVRGRAMSNSGIDKVPPQFLSQYLQPMAEAEATIKADTYKTMAADTRREQDGILERGLQDELPSRSEQFNAALESNTDLEIVRKDFARWLQGNHDKYVKAGLYTSAGFTERVWGAMGAQITSMRARGDWEPLMDLVKALKDGTSGTVKTSTGENLFDMPIGDTGSSIRTRLAAAEAELRPAYEQFQSEQSVKQFGSDLASAAQGDGDAVLRITAALPTLANDPKAMSQVMSLASQAQSFSRTPTDAQLREQQQLEMEFNNPNRDRATFNQRIGSANLTLEQKIKLTQRNTQPDDPVLGLIGKASAYGTDELNQTAMNIYKAGVATGRFSATADPETVKGDLRGIMTDLRIKASKATETAVQSLIKSGKDVGETDVLNIYRQNLTKIREGELQKLKASPDLMRTPGQRVLDSVSVVQDRMNLNRGVPTIGIFPVDVIRASKAAGIPQDYRNVSRFFVTQMRVAKGADGKPLFPDAEKAFQAMVRTAQGKPPQPAQAPPMRQNPNLPPDRTVDPTGGIPLVRGFNYLFDRFRGVPTPEPAPKPTGKPSDRNARGTTYGGPSARTQEQASGNLGHQILAKGLEIIGGAIAAPASAAEFPTGKASTPDPASPMARLMYPDASPVLASLWARRERIGPTTPALPQLASSMAAQSIPLSISNDMHPLFIAIGISEGTRTPSGGYTRAYYGHTDPGNGVHNVGTVSGQQGGSPQGSDRRWMATLTQKQLQLAPVLQRLGIPANSVAYNRLMFNALDLMVQAPAAYPDFVRQLPAILARGATIEAIAKARADSFINPRTGRLDAGGFGNSYSRLLADQRSRAGAFDYKRRL